MNKIFLFLLFFLASCSSIQTNSHHKKYLRTDWDHWSDLDGNCLDTRAEILKERSLVPIHLNKKGCKVKTGQWNDYYFDEIHTLASQVDIDHVVPLKHAHDSGAALWSPSQKQIFANDKENLVITNKHYNRQKGSKTIGEWLPVQSGYACKYVQDWVKIKNKYHLILGASEISTIEKLRGKCHFRF